MPAFPQLRNLFELPAHGSTARFRAMEGLRGFAVLLVFLTHYATAVEPFLGPGTPWAAVAVALRAAGHTGVDLFFVLSGYLIYRTLIARPPVLSSYLARRVERIYPAFLVSLAVYCALATVFPPEDGRFPAPWGALGLYVVQNLLLLPGLFPIQPIMTVAWSLSFEAFYYLAVPLAIAALSLRRWSVDARCALMAAVAAGLALWCWFYGGPIRLVMFLAGIVMHEFVDRRGGRVGAGAAVAGTVLALAAAAGLNAYETSGVWKVRPFQGAEFVQVGLLCAGYFLLCAHCIGGARSRVVRLFEWTPLRWLGNMSYSYYLLHALGIKAWLLVLTKAVPGFAPGPWALVAWLPVVFALSLLAPVVLFLLVERPFSLARPAGRRGAIPARAPVPPAA